MKQMKISNDKINPRLKTEVEPEFEWIEKIAQQYAKTDEELQSYYDVGKATFNQIKCELPQEKLEKVQVFSVRQAIMNFAANS
jgi:hypothetical protein